MCLSVSNDLCNVSNIPDILAPESRDTAAALIKLNDLFHVLNSSSRLAKCFNKRAISRMKPATAERHLSLLQEADQWLGRWVVGDGSVRIDSIGGLRQTIRGAQNVCEKCKGTDCRFLCTRRLNQDPLQNLFGAIRQRGDNMDTPDPAQFRHAYKHVVLNSLMVASETANCEADSDSLLTCLGMIAGCAGRGRAPPEAPVMQCAPEPEVVLDVPVDMVTKNCLSYVAGYLAHNADLQCDDCPGALVRSSTVATRDADVLTALKSHTGVSRCDVGSLKLPTPALCWTLSQSVMCVLTCMRGP